MERLIGVGSGGAAHGGGRRLVVLAHVAFSVEAAELVILLAAAVPADPTLAGWRSPLLLFAVLTVVVGWILAWKRPRVPIGWLMLGLGLLGTLQGPAAVVAVQLHDTAPSVAGWALEFGTESSWTWVGLLGLLLSLIPLRFPTGALPSPRWRWFWWTSIAVLVVGAGIASTFEPSMQLHVPSPTYVDWGATRIPLERLTLTAILAVFIGSLVSLLVRYRRADQVERTQLRWLFWALAVVVGLLIVSVVENAVLGDEDSGGVRGFVAHLFDSLDDLSYSLIPLAIMVAVLRSGLYAIDRIISRTAAYSIVSLSVVAVYVAVVLLGSLLLPKQASAGVAIATLAAAAAFLPLLRLLRRGIDRRFDRARYDAQRVVEAFGERVRTGADPQHSGDDLVAAVQRALQPTAVGLWLLDRTAARPVGRRDGARIAERP